MQRPTPNVDGPLGDPVRELLDERAIQHVLVGYCQGVDRRDWDQVRSCYHDDAFDSHGAFAGGPDELVSWLEQRHRHVLSSMHVLTNVSIQFSTDGDNARAESYCLSFQQVDPSDGDPFAGEGNEQVFTTIGLRYVDTLARRPELGWRIVRRDVVIEWMRRDSTSNFHSLDPSWSKATRDRSDLLYLDWPTVGA